MEEEFEYFSHCLLTDTDPHADGRHGLTDIRTLKAVYESDRSGSTVSMSD
jgi:xylose dehydrogenase (NAD/NADP)